MSGPEKLFRFLKNAGFAVRRGQFHVPEPPNVKNSCRIVAQNGRLTNSFKSSGWINSCWVQFGQLGRVPKSKFSAFLPQPQNSSTKLPNSWNTLFVRTLRRKAEKQPQSHPPKGSKNNQENQQHQRVYEYPPVPSRLTGMDRYHLIFKPIAFTALVGTTSIIGCTIWQYEEYRKQVAHGRFSLSSIPGFGGPSGDDNPSSPSRSRSQVSIRLESWWNSLSPGEKVFWPICIINGLVCLAWRMPAFSKTMITYFSCAPMGRAVCLPMVFSIFSHYSIFHLCANMFVLHSFIPAAAQIMGKEQFLALYLTSGTVASLGSHLHKILIGSNVPSLGASGAIMGILGLVCTRMPDIQLGIIFLPGIQFTADTALKCILAVDVAGLLSGWRFMDHAAHLAGCLFGIAFSNWGKDTFWAFRDFIMTRWHKIRTQGF